MSAPFWQVGVVVDDLEASMSELTAALGLDWTEPIELTWNEWSYRLVLSRQGPPCLELLEGPPGSPWDASAGSRIDHIAFWTDDLAHTRRHLEANGIPVADDGQAVGLPLNYHHAPVSGMRLEAVDASFKVKLREVLGLDAD